MSFLPSEIKNAVERLNYDYITEIRLRRGQPVIIEYQGEYKYVGPSGLARSDGEFLGIDEIEPVINSATGGCIYNYVEQMKSGFITVEHGIRIGIAGEYVTQGGEVLNIKNITSLNIRIPHNVLGCADYLVKNLFSEGLHSTALFSKPGLGKTTLLRDTAINLSKLKKYNILVFDERNEIAAIDGYGNGFNLGDRVDVIRCHNKKSAISSAIRAMKPHVIITDELYGAEDIKAMEYACDCGITVIASTHICSREQLKSMPFEFYAELTGIGDRPVIYDKDFNTYCGSGTDDFDRNFSVGK